MSNTPASGEPDPRKPLSAERRELLQLLQQERERATAVAVSSAQERFWFLEQLEPGNPAHHVAGSSVLRGPLDCAALQRATEALVARHEQLRARFPTRGGRPQIVIAEASPTPLPLHDLRHLASNQQEAARQQLQHDLVLPAFDLSTGPLLRQALLQLDDEEFELLWCFHHIIVDGLSMAVLANECAALYAAERSGQQLRLEPVRSYREHAHQQTEWFASPRCQELETEWLQRLEGLSPLDIGDPLPAGPAPPLRGSRTSIVLDHAEAGEMLRAARALGVTPFQWFVTGFAALLHRCTGATDFAIGTPVAGRDPAFANVVGFFVNSLVLRVDCAKQPRFKVLAERIRQESLWAYDRTDLPFERLVAAVAPQRHPHRHPLFQVMCNHVGFTPPQHFADLEQQYRELPSGTLLALTFYVRRHGDRIQLEFEYDTRRFSASLLERWLLAIRVLLQAAALDPTQRVADLPLIDEAVAKALRSAGAGPPLPAAACPSLPQMILEQCGQHPNRVAVRCEGATLSYRELATRTEQLARGLRVLGATGGQRIAVCGGRDLDLIPVLLAIMANGDCYVPLQADHPAERNRQILSAAAPLLVIADAATAASLPPESPCVGLSEITAAAQGAAQDSVVSVLPEQAAYLIFTSGSTGEPKGVTVPHRAVTSFLQAIAQQQGLTAEDEMLAITSLGFDIAVLELFAPLTVGAAVCLADTAATGDPALLHSLLADAAITVAQATPTTWRLLQRHGFEGRPNLRLLAGGEALPADLAAFLRPRCTGLCNLYGPTETTVWSAAWPVPAEFAAGHPVRIGRALAGQWLRVLDANGLALPPGTVGELAIGGCGVSLGYLDDPVMTADRFRDDPLGQGLLYRTGDRARLEVDGSFSCLGRIDEQLKVHGYRLEPGDVESALRLHPEVADAAVDVRGLADRQRLCAWLVPAIAENLQEPKATLANWAQVWDATYAAVAHSAPGTDSWDLAGWNDRATGQSLPPSNMRRFYDRTLHNLRRLAPSRILELGCGSGQLLLGMAAQSEHYVGIDASATAIERLRRTTGSRDLPVDLHCADAADLASVLGSQQRFDLIILNSVIQYFPDVAYLVRLIDQAADFLAQGGVLFLGDIRLLSLQPAWCASMAVNAADRSGQSLAEAAAGVARDDRELLVDLRFFEALLAEHPRLTGLRARLHEHEADDELTRFRVNVYLFADAIAEPQPREVEATDLANAIAGNRVEEPLQATAVLDPRSAPWVFLAEQLGSAQMQVDADILSALQRRQAECSTLPTAAWWIRHAATHNCDIELRPGDRPGTMEITTRSWRPAASTAKASQSHTAWDAAAFAATQAARLAVGSNVSTVAGQTVDLGSLRQHLQQHLPKPAIPSAFAMVTELPRSANGKLLRRSLADPSRPLVTGRGGPPSPGLERMVAEAFVEILGIDMPGAQDDFFALGGHSLLAVRVTTSLQQRTGRHVPLQRLFQSPTVAGLAAAIDQAPAGSASAPLCLPHGTAKPLLVAHERIWFLQRLEPHNSAYHLAGLVTFDADVTTDCLRAALEQVANRHILLCSAIDAGLDGPKLQPATPEIVDDPADGTEFDAAIAARIHQPFDLERDAPLRAWLHHTPDRTQVLLVLHHAAADGWSLSVLTRDLAVCLEGLLTDSASDLPALPWTPADWAAQQRAALASGELDPSLAFWRQTLDGSPRTLDLPTDRPRPALPSHTGGRLHRPIAASLWQAAHERAADLGTTPFHVFLAAFAELASRLTLQQDMVVGTVSAGRDHPGLADQVGCFINLLPLRFQLGQDASWSERIEQSRDVTTAALTHASVPFARIIAEVDPPRDLSRPPLVQGTFEWLELPTASHTVAGHPYQVRELAGDRVKFDLTMRVHPGSTPRLEIDYATDLFEEDTVAGWCRSFEELLQQAVRLPTDSPRSVVEASALHPDDLRRMQAWATGPQHQPPGESLTERIQRVARAQPDHNAVTWEGGGQSFRQLMASMQQVAAQLRLAGIGPGSLVGLVVPRGRHLLPACLGTLASGATYLPLTAQDPAFRREQLLEASGACAVLSVDASMDELQIDLRENGQPLAGQPAYVMFTSGSTGQPKAVVVGHTALLSYLDTAAKRYLDPTGRGSVLHTAMTFDLTVTSLYAPLLNGQRVHMAPEGPGIEPLLAARAHGPFAFLKVTPAHLRAMQAAETELPQAATWVVGGDVMHTRDVSPLLRAGARVVNEYGPTEATVGCVSHELSATATATADDQTQPIGKPLPGVVVSIRDAHQQPSPPGALGELWIGGPGLAEGYLDDPQQTAERFVEATAGGARMYRTGDLVRWRHDGNLEFCRRKDDQVQILGVRIEPQEIEHALRALPSVVEAAVRPLPAPSGVQLGAWVVSDTPITGEALLEALQARLPSALLPRFVRVLDSMPLNRHGKVDRAALTAPPPRTLPATTENTSHGSATQQFCTLMTELLSAEVHPDDDFFALGGDSILALQLVARAREATLGVTVRDVFTHRTPARLAMLSDSQEPPLATAWDPRSPVPLLPIQRQWLERDLTTPGHDVQAVLCELSNDVATEQLDEALVLLQEAHPILHGQLVTNPGRLLPGAGPVVRCRQAPNPIATACAQANASHAPSSGRVFAATRLRDGSTDLLHLSAHHLVVDALSWTVLLRDLDRALQGQTLSPGPPAAAFPHALAELDFAGEARLWQTMLGEQGARWPATIRSERGEHSFEFGQELAWPHSATERRASVHEMLLAAMFAALHECAGGSLRIDLERHGRMEISGAPDISRAIGWFTAVHPLRVPAAQSPADWLRATKKVLRSIPNDGIGYGALRWLHGRHDLAPASPACLLFNFLGTMDPPSGQLLHATTRDPGPLRDPNHLAQHPLEFDLWLQDKVLRGRLRRSDGTPRQSAEELLAAFGRQLCALGQTDPGECLEPGDFPQASVDDRQLHSLGVDGIPSHLFASSPTQQGMLVHALQDPVSEAYTEQLVHVVEGPLRPDAIRAALMELQRRHVLLRGELVWRGLDEPHWRVGREHPTPFAVRTITDKGPAEARQFLDRFTQADRRAGFDLGRAPLWRCTQVRMPQQRHALVFTYHHVLMDGWSMPLFLGELLAAYRAACLGQRVHLPPALPYQEYIAWLQRQDHDAARLFWRRQLSGFSQPTKLGVDRTPAPTAAPLPHRETERWTTESTAQTLRDLASACQTTGSTLVQAALATWLARTGAAVNPEPEDVLFGVTVAGRPAELPAAETRIGLFINTIPMRLRVNEQASVRALLDSVQQQNVASMPWHWTPLTISQSQADGPPGEPLFDVLLVYENYPLDGAAEVTPPGLVALETWTNERTSYPLTLVVVPGDRWLLRALYAPDRIPAECVERLLEQLEHLLLQFAADTARPLAQISVLPEPETKWLAARSSTPAIDAKASVLQQFASQVARAPDAPALLDRHVTWSYADLASQSQAIATELRSRGLQPDDLIAIDIPRCAMQIAAVLGVWQAHGVVVPLDARWSEGYTDHVLQQADCRLVLATAASRIDGIPVVRVDQLPRRKAPPNHSPRQVDDQDVAACLFTSGSSGQAKAVEVLHGGLRNYTNAARIEFALGPQDRVLQFASLSFDTAFEEILPTLATGAALVLREEDLSPPQILAQCASHQVTVVDFPTAYFHVLAAHLESRNDQLPDCVRLCILGGEVAQPRPVAAFLQRHPLLRLLNSYGPTEASIVSCWCDLERSNDRADQPLPIGKPVPGTAASVRDLRGRLLPIGAIGELWLAGEGLARGYRNDPEATRRRFVAHPDQPGQRCYRTGDLVRWQEDGQLAFCGRTDRQLKLRGQRVEPDAIENALASHQDVHQVAVVGDRDPDDVLVGLLAFVVPAGDTDLDPASLKEFAQARLAGAAIPCRIVPIAELPRTAHGKVDHQRLLTVGQSTPLTPPVGEPTEVSTQVQSVFAAVLRCDVTPDDDFFELGGNSLAAIGLIDALHERAGIHLTLAQLFRLRSPRAVALHAETKGDRDRSPPTLTSATVSDTTKPDLVLDDSLTFQSAPTRDSATRHWLVTGGTGFLGRRIVAELLSRDDITVTVLARQPNPVIDPEARAVLGSLDQPHLGLDPETWQRLADDVDAVVHVAANTNVWLPYEALRPDNVEGTRHVLEFCAASGAALHHVSTVGIFADPGLTAGQAIDEDFDVTQLGAVQGGYPQSKWVAEQLVRQAARRGLAAAIYRPGRLTAGLDGDLPQSDFGLGLFTLGLELGAVPDLDMSVDLTPVDWAASALVQLALRPRALDGAEQAPPTWHLVQDPPTPMSELWNLLDEAGIPLRRLPLTTWYEVAKAHVDNVPEHPSRALLDLLGPSMDNIDLAAAAPKIVAPRTYGALKHADLPPVALTEQSLAAVLNTR